MQVTFQTKAESQRQQQEAFLKLTGDERFMNFLMLSRKINRLFPIKNKVSFEERYKGNFLIRDEYTANINVENSIEKFIKLAHKFKLKMILAGGGAFNVYGYQRSSSNVNFWIDTNEDNLKKLVNVFKNMGYEIDKFPEKVTHQMQNISVKFSPYDLDLELITRFSVGKTFEEAYQDSTEEIMKGEKMLRWRVLSYDDLITSKIKSSRPKDILDIQQLKLIQNNK